MMMGLQCHRLSFERPLPGSGAQPVLNQIEAEFECGRVTLVTGETGAGKSTLLNLLGVMLRPTSGELRADGQPVSRWSADHRDMWRRQVGMVFQHLHLVLSLSVLENILLPVIPLEIDWQSVQARVCGLLDDLGLNGLEHEQVVHLSGGQRQRVALARALINQPRFLLLDEPTAFQDDPFASRIQALWQNAAQQGACVVVSAHDARLTLDGHFQRRYRLVHGHLELLP
jgi:ABC-type lipoprotein export system ATPase subunit